MYSKFSVFVVLLSTFCIVLGSYINNIFTETPAVDELNQILVDNDSGYRAPFLESPEYVENRYLIKFVSHEAMIRARNAILKIIKEPDPIFEIHECYDLIPGCVVSMGNLTRDVFSQMKETELIERDSIYKVAQATPTANLTKACSGQTSSDWCLSRIINIDPNANDVYNYSSNAGSNVTIYIIDTGVNVSHPDIIGRARNCANFVSGEPDGDQQGHGTACASMAAGNLAGVAKEANICSVKVLNKDGSGMASDIIGGVLWVAQQPDKSIVSMSLGGMYNFFLNMAVSMMISMGQFAAIAAGNSAADACMASPASVPSAYTVAASNKTNTLAYFSNYGTCVDIIAPGTKCKLANYTTGVFAYASGTSMATPLVAGWAAIQKGYNKSLTPAQMTDLLNKLSLKNAINGDLKGTPNHFIHSSCE